MGDVGDYWNDHKAYVRERKERQRSAIPAAMKLLSGAGVSYRCLDGGEHYRVAEAFDWWPSTGRWRSMDGKKSGFKVRGLIAAIKAEGLTHG